MTVQDLINRLATMDPNAEVMILDGFNGSGTPREVNFGPTTHVITDENGDDAADCEELVGTQVVIIGYGCY